MAKSCDKDLLEAKKKLQKSNSLEEMRDLESKEFWAEHLAKDYRKEARVFSDLKRQIESDIKGFKPKTQNKANQSK